MKILKYGATIVLICGGAVLGGLLLRNGYADATPWTLTMIVCLWAALVIAGVLAIYHMIVSDNAQKRAEAATAAHGNSAMVSLYVQMLFMICFDTSKPVGFYLNWTEEFLRANGGYEGVLRCMRTETTPHILDIGAEPLRMSAEQHEEIAGAVKMMRHQVV